MRTEHPPHVEEEQECLLLHEADSRQQVERGPNPEPFARLRQNQQRVQVQTKDGSSLPLLLQQIEHRPGQEDSHAYGGAPRRWNCAPRP